MRGGWPIVAMLLWAVAGAQGQYTSTAPPPEAKNITVLIVAGNGASTIDEFRFAFADANVTMILYDTESSNTLRASARLVDVVYIDGSVSSSNLKDKLADTKTPVVVANDGSGDDFRLCAPATLYSLGTSVDLTVEATHFFGFDPETVEVYTEAGDLVACEAPASGAIPFAKGGLGYLFDRNTLDKSGRGLLGRRVYMWGDRAIESKFTPAGIAITFSALHWASGWASPPQSVPQIVTGSVTITGSTDVNNVTFAQDAMLTITGNATLSGVLVIQLDTIPTEDAELQLISVNGTVSGIFELIQVNTSNPVAGCVPKITPNYSPTTFSVTVEQHCTLSKTAVIGVVVGAVLLVLLVIGVPTAVIIARRKRVLEAKLDRVKLQPT